MKNREYRKEALSTLRGLKKEELEVRERELREQLFWLEFKRQGGQLDQTSNLKKTKRALAQLKTIQKETRV